jgi:hypothetical protein
VEKEPQYATLRVLLQVLIAMASKFIVAFALLGCLAFASAQKTVAGSKSPAAQKQAAAWQAQKHAPLTGECVMTQHS